MTHGVSPLALALTGLLVVSPALAGDGVEQLEAACGDLFAQLPAEWPAHLAGEEPLGVLVGQITNRSNDRGVNLAALLETAHAQVEGHPRLTPDAAEQPSARLLLVGSVHGKDPLQAQVALYDVARRTLLAVGRSHRLAPEAMATLVDAIKARAAEGWPAGLPLAESGKPAVRLARIRNRTRRRDVDLDALYLELSAGLLRTGVVEVEASSRDAMRAISQVRDAAATAETTEPLPEVGPPQVGLVVAATLQEEQELELTLRLISSVDQTILVAQKVPLADLTMVPVSSAEAKPAASPSPEPSHDTGRRQSPRSGR